jgi:hypothetical protein
VSRRCLAASISILALSLSAGVAGAEETWVVTGGRTSIHLYDYLLRDLGFEVVDVRQTASNPTGAEARMEPPFLSFMLSPDTDLSFRTRYGHYLNAGWVSGTLGHEGGFSLRHAASGLTADFSDFTVDHRPEVESQTVGAMRDYFFIQPQGMSSYAVELIDAEPIFDRGAQTFGIYNLSLLMTEELATAIGYPMLAGQPIGSMVVEADVRFESGSYEGEAPAAPDGTFLDVEIAWLYSITSLGHSGTYPNGVAGLSMSTTSCNPGDVEALWQAPMDEDHPTIAMQFYRETNGLLEQIGVSWAKHGFYALSSNECGYGCSGTDGTRLGVGCSDTYGTGNNGDRYWLGPRDEINPYEGTWTCNGSFFSGYQPDCVRRETGSGWGPTAHRLEVQDADLDVSGATYYYEGYYVVAGDQDKSNNIAHRRCTTEWEGAAGWDLDPVGSEVQTPVILQWGDQQTMSNAPGDGVVITAVKVDDLGGGDYRYSYNVFNRDSDRQVREITIPVGSATVSDLTYHDSDFDDGNDWDGGVDGSFVTWSTDDYDTDPDANAIEFGYMVTVAFTADVPPVDSQVQLGLFKPGTGEMIVADSKAPGAAVGVNDPAAGIAAAHLGAARPNPARAGATTIAFELQEQGQVDLSVYDTQGRMVRSLVAGTRSVGSHTVEWDGRDQSGQKVASGVYYYRIEVGSFRTGKSMVVID